MRVGMTVLLVVFAGCTGRVPGTSTDAAAPIDAATIDAARAVDSGNDAASTVDAGHDGAIVDAGHDAATVVDAGRDAATVVDAGRDAATVVDAGHDTGPLADAGGRTLECVPAVAGNELNSGMVLGPNFWVGFRFEITAATTLTGVGFDVQPDPGASGTVLAGIVALTGPSDAPNTPNLTGTDVLGTTLVPVTPAGFTSVVASAPLSVPLPVGWYALEIGIGGGGATLTGATVHSNSGNGGCSLPGSSFPFSIRQTDGMLILQAATPNFFVAVSP